MRHDRLALPGRGRFYGRERGYSSFFFFFSFHCAQLPRFLEAAGERGGRDGGTIVSSPRAIVDESAFCRRIGKRRLALIITTIIPLEIVVAWKDAALTTFIPEFDRIVERKFLLLQSRPRPLYICVLKYDGEIWSSRSTRCCTGVINHPPHKFYSTVGWARVEQFQRA